MDIETTQEVQRLLAIADEPYGVWEGTREGRTPRNRRVIQRVRMNDGSMALRLAYMGEIDLDEDHDDDYDEYRGGRQTRRGVIGWRSITDRPEHLACLRAWLIEQQQHRLHKLSAPPDDDREHEIIEAARQSLRDRIAALEEWSCD